MMRWRIGEFQLFLGLNIATAAVLGFQSAGFHPRLFSTRSRPTLVWSKLNDKRLSDSNLDTKPPLVLNAEDVTVIAKDDNPQQGTTRLPAASPDVDPFKFQTTAYDLSQAALVGVVTGVSVVGFKLSVDLVRRLAYEEPMLLPHPELRALIPALGGLCVGVLLLLGSFPPGLRKTIRLVDQATEPGTFETRSLITVNSMRKSAAAVFTLGTVRLETLNQPT
jgi:hypothetical protein